MTIMICTAMAKPSVEDPRVQQQCSSVSAVSSRTKAAMLILGLLSSTFAASNRELLPQPGPQPSVTVTSNISSTQRDIGYLGAYHPTKVEASRSPAGAATKSLQAQFAFGIVAIQNTAVDSGRNLEDDLVAHCGVADGAQQIIGLLLPPTEGGVVSNITDTSLFAPPRYGAGLVQGAARWSKLARNVSACENGAIAGVVIDDFFTNFAGDAPGPGQPCAQCPANSSHLYGGTLDGYFCCPEDLSSTHHCASGHECCLTSGSLGHCQGIPKCGTNPLNYQPCHSDPGKTKITLEDMREIKGALQGRVVDAKTGKVDWTSPATTPDLRLWTVIYNRLVSAFLASDLVNASLADPAVDADTAAAPAAVPVLDGVSLWIEGPSQAMEYLNFTTFAKTLRLMSEPIRLAATLPSFGIVSGAYIEHSATGTMKPGPFASILSQSRELHGGVNADVRLEGMYTFAGSSVSRCPPGPAPAHSHGCLNESMWEEWALPAMLDSEYSNKVGTACLDFGKQYAGTEFTVRYGYWGGAVVVGVHVARKRCDLQGRFCFGGYADNTSSTGSDIDAPARSHYVIKGSGPLGVWFPIHLEPRRNLTFTVQLQ